MRWAAGSERLADRIPAKGRVPNWSNDIVMAHLRLTPLLALLLAGPQANAADRGFAALVADVEADLVDTEQRASKLARDYEQRRGLIGAEEATRRYDVV